MDEPLSNLDAKLRVETRANIAALRTTTIYVTHDQVDTVRIAAGQEPAIGTTLTLAVDAAQSMPSTRTGARLD